MASSLYCPAATRQPSFFAPTKALGFVEEFDGPFFHRAGRSAAVSTTDARTDDK
jgi:hypothetical protein